MSSFISKLNLRPSELRLVVVVASVVMVVLYALFIYPQFKEWKALQKKKGDLEMSMARYQKEIARKAQYETELKKLQEKGARVDADAQALDLQRVVDTQATQHRVQINGYSPGRGPVGGAGRTNAYFEEQTGTINYVAEEPALLSFLHALSTGNSLIRVSSMTLAPDPTKTKLMGNITFVASYRKATTKATASAPTPAVRPSGSDLGPKSISAAMTASARPATNRPSAASWWGRVEGWGTKMKGLFAARKPAATNAPPGRPAATAAPPRKPAATNPPPAKK
jgi:hypothetical protein